MFKSKYTGEEIESILDNAKTPYSVATTTSDGLMPQLPTDKINGWYGDNVFTPAMQFVGGDGQYKALDIQFTGNKIMLCFCDDNNNYGEISADVPMATKTDNGLMSKNDKSLLDGFHSVMNENGSYILTETGITGDYSWNNDNSQMEFASMSVPGNWLSADGWEFTEDNLFYLPNIPVATATTGGVMSPEDKKKIDSIKSSENYTANIHGNIEIDLAGKPLVPVLISAEDVGHQTLSSCIAILNSREKFVNIQTFSNNDSTILFAVDENNPTKVFIAGCLEATLFYI